MNLFKIQDEKLKACYAGLKRAQHFIHLYKFEIEDYIMQAYLKILEKNKTKDLTYEEMSTIARNAIVNCYAREINIKEKKDKLSFFTECYEEEKNVNIIKDESFDNNLKYEILKECFIEFLKNSNYNKHFIIDKLLKNTKSYILAKRYKIQTQKQTEIIYQFRQEFLNYLVKVGYFESVNNFKIEKSSENAKNVSLYVNKKRQGENFDYKQCKNDIKLYQLIRDDILNINKYAEVISIPTSSLEKTIKHKEHAISLKLYQINILRKKYFNNYTLEELVSI